MIGICAVVVGATVVGTDVVLTVVVRPLKASYRQRKVHQFLQSAYGYLGYIAIFHLLISTSTQNIYWLAYIYYTPDVGREGH